MTNPASVANQNILPVQAYFNVDGSFNTFIGQGQPFTVSGQSGLTVLDVPTLNATLYPTFSVLSSGVISALDVASTKVTFNPSTGIFAAPTFQGALTGLASSATNLAGGLNGYLPYQTASGATTFLTPSTNGYVLTLAGGVPTWAASASGAAAITDDTTTNGTRYINFTAATTGSLANIYTSSTKLQYNPSTGQLTTTSYAGTWAGTALTNAQLANSAITINGSSISLGGTVSVGTVTSVTGTAPVVSSGGATPAISMAAATTSVSGYLTSTDWNTFNNKGSVSSVAGTGTVNGLTLTGTVTTSGSLTLGGTLSLVSPPPIGTTTPAEVKVTTGWSPNFALTDAATVAWDSTNQVATFTFVSSNRTMGAPTNLKNGAFYALAVIQNAGSNTLTWNSVFKWAGGSAPTLSTAAGAKDYFTFRSDGTNLYEQGRALADA